MNAVMNDETTAATDAATDAPAAPELPAATEIAANVLAGLAMIAPQKDIRYYLRGVYFDPDGFAVATDGHTLIAARVPSFSGPGFIVPNEAIKMALAGIRSGSRVAFMLPVKPGIIRGVTFTPIDGRFPDWRRVVPQKPSGERAVYDPDKIATLQKIARTMTGVSRTFVFLTENGEGAGIYTPDGGDWLALVMPMRWEPRTPDEAAASVAKFMARE